MTEFDSPRPDMKIYSWNVLDRNASIPGAAKWVRELDFDVLCLQEVNEELLAELRTMPFHLAFVPEMKSRNIFGRTFIRYSAILSRYPLGEVERIELPHDPPPLRTRAFIVLMTFMGFAFVSEHGALAVIVVQPSGPLQIICAHLTLRGPKNRKNEFRAVLGKRNPDLPAIVCGDFNIIEWGPLKILNWLLGGTFSEALPWYPERELFEERFGNAGFTNPLRGMSTHPFSKSQLDHILVSKDFEVQNASVLSARYGSDHQPVRIVTA